MVATPKKRKIAGGETMGGRKTTWRLVLAAAALSALPLPAVAQSVPGFSANLPGMSPLSQQQQSSQQSSQTFDWAQTQSCVSFIDSAMPRTMTRIRCDLNYDDVRPTRGEYLFPKGGIPGSPGLPLPETRIDTQELAIYQEVSLVPEFSFFFSQPYRFVNPEVNANTAGIGDLDFGIKYVLFGDASMMATLQMRAYVPLHHSQALGTDHASFEPAVLFNWTVASFLRLEGEFRYWVPIGGTDFAGDNLRYGLGLVYGQPSPSDIWITPMVEVVGWSILSGKTMVAQSADSFYIQDASGSTIVNGYLGVRLGLGATADVYLGYGHAFTGPAWYRDMARVEVRFFF
jgi:hypothetical protein